MTNNHTETYLDRDTRDARYPHDAEVLRRMQSDPWEEHPVAMRLATAEAEAHGLGVWLCWVALFFGWLFGWAVSR